MVIQDQFVPFDGQDFKLPHFRLHQLPWPKDVLRDLGSTPIALRVTLSYFIEPTGSRRGWRERFVYNSHGLRFELKDPLESSDDFVRSFDPRSHIGERDDSTSGSRVNWLLGPKMRHKGSLHQDQWEATAAELADAGEIAVYPVGGWWKKNRVKSRMNKAIRYSLIVSLKTAESSVDLYTPIATALQVPIGIEAT